jgi:membrane protease YdiL (CAAX protease family)
MRAFANSLRGRLALSSFMYVSFYILSPIIGIDGAFLVLLPPFLVITIIAYIKMGLTRIVLKNAFLSSAIVTALFVGTTILFPLDKIDEWFTIVIMQGLREELFFRFSVLGVLKASNGWDGLNLVRKASIIITNALLFAILHVQYQAILNTSL